MGLDTKATPIWIVVSHHFTGSMSMRVGGHYTCTLFIINMTVVYRPRFLVYRVRKLYLLYVGWQQYSRQSKRIKQSWNWLVKPQAQPNKCNNGTRCGLLNITRACDEKQAIILVWPNAHFEILMLSKFELPIPKHRWLLLLERMWSVLGWFIDYSS